MLEETDGETDLLLLMLNILRANLSLFVSTHHLSNYNDDDDDDVMITKQIRRRYANIIQYCWFTGWRRRDRKGRPSFLLRTLLFEIPHVLLFLSLTHTISILQGEKEEGEDEAPN